MHFTIKEWYVRASHFDDDDDDVDLEWKIVYVGSAEDDRYDQTLDQIMVGPVPMGINRFVFQVTIISICSFISCHGV